MHRSQRILSLLFGLGALTVGGVIALSPDPSGPWAYPLGQRLLYVHVPLAWVAYLGYGAAGVASFLVITRSSHGANRVLRSLLEVTTVFAATGLATGLAWSYEFQGFDPLADPKVVATLVLVAVLAGLWTLGATTPGTQADKRLAALTLMGMVTVPASYLASRLATPHPDFATTTEITPTMATLLAVASLGWLFLFTGASYLRHRQLTLEEARTW
ncbi:MAG: cytochrome c biogenesis protein CcsA [Candidatus Thermoplasmatota archaeon]|nr:cytochrome c biogenesis protein CcsA [Candidatus Thermoplasmatota archaeon]